MGSTENQVDFSEPVEEASTSVNNGESTEIAPAGHSEFYEKMITRGIKPAGATALEQFVKDGLMAEGDLDDRALDALCEFDDQGCREVLSEFASGNLSHVSNKSAYLCGVMKTWRQRGGGVADTPTPATPGKAPASGGADETKIKAILDRTGYTLEVTSGQRKYGGPPPGWEGNQPGAGHVVFIGKVPKFIFEEDLIPVFEECGKIWDLRLMMDPVTSQNKGYAFVTYCQKEAATKAVKTLNDHEIKPGRRIKVNISIANQRLFLGSINKAKTKEEIHEEVAKITEGVVEVIVYKPTEDTKKHNRGFAFIEYENHKLASSALRKLQSGRHKVFGIQVQCNWAEPMEEPDAEVMAKVKVLYVRNLTIRDDEDMLLKKFEPYGKIERVKKVKDYAFVHFEDREKAMEAMNDLNGQKLGDQPMEISLAKPVTEKNKRNRMQGGSGGFGGPPWQQGGGNWGGPGGMSQGPRRQGPPPMMRGRGGSGGYMPRFSGGGYGGDRYDYDDGGYGGGVGGYGGDYDDHYYDYQPRPPMSRGRAIRGHPPMSGGRVAAPPRLMREPHGFSPAGRGGRGRGSPVPPLGGTRGLTSPLRGGARGGIKRKPYEDSGRGGSGSAAKRRTGEWGESPIAQQPLGGSGSGGQWFQDSYHGSW